MAKILDTFQDKQDAGVAISRRAAFALAGILALALVLRLWGIGFGLPYAYHIDEPTYTSAALNLGAGIVGRQPNPTGFSNALFAEYAAFYLVNRVAGVFHSTADFELAYRSDISIFLLLGRLTTVGMGVLNVLAVYWLGRRMHGPLAGLLASAFLAVAFLHVRDSHYSVPDVAATCLVTLCVLLCALAVGEDHRRYYNLAAAVGGLAIATKWSIWQVAIPLALAALYGWRARRKATTAGRWGTLVLMGLCFLGGFLLGGFQLLWQPATFVNYALRELTAGEGGGFGDWQIDTVPGWLFYAKTLLYGLGVVLLALAVVGWLRRLIQTIRTRDKVGVLVLAFPVFYFAFMGATRHYFARYALPLTPFMALFAADAVVALFAFLRMKRAALGWGVVALLTVAAVIEPLAESIRHDLLLTRQDTRTLAKAWVEANLPAGARIATDWPGHTPPLSTSERPMPNSARVYDVLAVGGTGLADHPIEWYREQNFDYLIASSYIYNIPLVSPEQDARRRAFYAALDQELALVQEFRPYAGDQEPRFIFDEIYGPAINLWQRDRPGPTLKIYKVQ